MDPPPTNADRVFSLIEMILIDRLKSEQQQHTQTFSLPPSTFVQYCCATPIIDFIIGNHEDHFLSHPNGPVSHACRGCH